MDTVYIQLLGLNIFLYNFKSRETMKKEKNIIQVTNFNVFSRDKKNWLPH